MERPINRPTRYPVTLKQRFVLMHELDPYYSDDPRGSWLLCSAMMVRPRVDLRRLRRAFRNLCQRHDSLRMRFETAKDGWTLVIDAQSDADITEIDLGELDEPTLVAQMTEIANAPMSLLGKPLVEMTVARCGSKGDAVIWRVNHIIADGYSMELLMQELWAFLLGYPIQQPALSFPDYLKHFTRAPRAKAAEFDAFWENKFANPPPAPKIGRMAKGLPPNLLNRGGVENRRLSVLASAKDFERLRARAERQNSSLASMLFAGYLEALCQNYSVDCLLFSTSVSRTNPALESFVVDHTQVPILKYRMAGSLGCDHACRSVHTDLMMAMDHLPHESAWRGTRYEEQLIAQGAHPRQFQCNQSRAASRRARSAIGSDHAPSVSGEWQLGPYSITPYDVSIFRWNWFDLQFRTREEPPEQGFHLAYDGVSYTRDEIHALAMTICTLLDIEPVEFDEN